MINSEVLELRKRFRKDKATFHRVAGCFVNEKKEKVYVFNKSFASLPEDEMVKYLEIATKSLSGKINNNLLNIEFPVEEEKTGGSQHELYELHKSSDDEEKLNEFYDKIITSYQFMHNYLIVLFFDEYDVPSGKGEDEDFSGRVFDYMICGICPIELSQPLLGYIDEETGLAITNRNLIVKVPDTGFLFPSFTDRQADIHSVLFYTRDARSPHSEFIDDILKCEQVSTSAQKKMLFNDIVALQLSGMSDEEVSDTVVDLEYRLQQMVDAHKADNGEMAVLRMNEETIQELIDDADIDDDFKDGIITALSEVLDEETDASILITQKNLKLGEVRSEKQAIANALSKTTKELEEYKERESSGVNKYEKKVIDGVEYMLIPKDHGTKIIHGIEYILVPTENIE